MARMDGEIGVIIVEHYDEIGNKTLTISEYLGSCADHAQAMRELGVMRDGSIVEHQSEDSEDVLYYYHAGSKFESAFNALVGASSI